MEERGLAARRRYNELAHSPSCPSSATKASRSALQGLAIVQNYADDRKLRRAGQASSRRRGPEVNRAGFTCGIEAGTVPEISGWGLERCENWHAGPYDA